MARQLAPGGSFAAISRVMAPVPGPSSTTRLPGVERPDRPASLAPAVASWARWRPPSADSSGNARERAGGRASADDSHLCDPWNGLPDYIPSGQVEQALTSRFRHLVVMTRSSSWTTVSNAPAGTVICKSLHAAGQLADELPRDLHALPRAHGLPLPPARIRSRISAGTVTPGTSLAMNSAWRRLSSGVMRGQHGNRPVADAVEERRAAPPTSKTGCVIANSAPASTL